ncbi:unnamed protein product [marine sediment metagenome]|uniref:Uncharacterized protein n=1 Tax=marine sediment metagenome TaxID=412755 RepID=X1HEZ2_9ZZZZ
MNNNDLFNKLRSGNQDPVQLVFHNIRTKEQLSALVSLHIEADSVNIIDLLNNLQMAKEWILNSAMNRFQLNFKRNVGAVSEEIRQCQPKNLNDWKNYYFKNVRNANDYENCFTFSSPGLLF